jgi:hypothetical protein
MELCYFHMSVINSSGGPPADSDGGWLGRPRWRRCVRGREAGADLEVGWVSAFDDDETGKWWGEGWGYQQGRRASIELKLLLGWDDIILREGYKSVSCFD